MKTVLITGATGAVGSALVPLFLEEPGTNVHLLIRAQSEAHLEERMNELRAFWGTEGNVTAHRGDVTEPCLGLSPEVFRRLAGELTHIVHAAGNVRLDQTPEAARVSAVGGLQNIIELAKAAPRLRKLEVVSTVGVSGNMKGLVPEAPLTEPGPFRNTYEASKAEAEGVLIKSGLPFTIHRPSMVVGDSTSGKIIHFQVFYHLAEFLTGRRTNGVVIDTKDVRLDIIPVDYVAKAIHISSRRSDTVGRIFHLTSGSEAPTIAELTRGLRQIFASWGLSLPATRRISPEMFRAGLPRLEQSLGPDERRAFRALPHFLAYLDMEQVFDNRRSRDYFSKAGLSLPRVEDYLGAVMEYYRAVSTEVVASR